MIEGEIILLQLGQTNLYTFNNLGKVCKLIRVTKMEIVSFEQFVANATGKSLPDNESIDKMRSETWDSFISNFHFIFISKRLSRPT
jgi:hypothetical protein